MTIAELFVNIGVKGEGTAVKALTKTKTGLADIASSGLAAKAAIVGLMYATEQMFAASSAAGTGLMNFNALTGIGAKELQQYQYAARQVGESNDSIAGSIKSVQSTMLSAMTEGGAVPAGINYVQQAAGVNDIMTRGRDTLYVMQQLQKAAINLPKDIGNSALKSFGLSEATIASMRRSAFRPDVFAKAPTYSPGEIGQLDRANAAWSNLGNKIEMAFGHFNAKHGNQLVNDISKIVDQVVHLADAFVILADKIKFFVMVGKVFEGWSLIFQGLTGGVSKFTDALTNAQKREKIKGEVGDFFKEMPATFGEMFKDITGQNEEYAPPKDDRKVKGKTTSPSVAPKMSPTTKSSVHHTTIKQDLHFQHEGKEARKTGDSVSKAIKDAIRQIPQGQGS